MKKVRTVTKNPKWKNVALSVQQPWASLICSGIKDIENRTWQTDYRGRLFIVASSSNVLPQFDQGLIRKPIVEAIKEQQRKNNFPLLGNLPQSAVIGYVDLVECTGDEVDSIWSDGSLEDGNVKPTKAENLSMGMKFFVLLRHMLLHGVLRDRDVLILDEPENHLHTALVPAFHERMNLGCLNHRHLGRFKRSGRFVNQDKHPMETLTDNERASSALRPRNARSVKRFPAKIPSATSATVIWEATVTHLLLPQRRMRRHSQDGIPYDANLWPYGEATSERPARNKKTKHDDRGVSSSLTPDLHWWPCLWPSQAHTPPHKGEIRIAEVSGWRKAPLSSYESPAFAWRSRLSQPFTKKVRFSQKTARPSHAAWFLQRKTGEHFLARNPCRMYTQNQTATIWNDLVLPLDKPLSISRINPKRKDGIIALNAICAIVDKSPFPPLISPQLKILPLCASTN